VRDNEFTATVASIVPSLAALVSGIILSVGATAFAVGVAVSSDTDFAVVAPIWRSEIQRVVEVFGVQLVNRFDFCFDLVCQIIVPILASPATRRGRVISLQFDLHETVVILRECCDAVSGCRDDFVHSACSEERVLEIRLGAAVPLVGLRVCDVNREYGAGVG